MSATHIKRYLERVYVIRHRDHELEASISQSGKVIELGNYPYTLHPFQAVLPQDPKFMEHATRIVCSHPNFDSNFDIVFALAQKSIPFATYISRQTQKPLSVAYSRNYDLMTPEMKSTYITITEPKKYAEPFVLHSYFLREGSRVTYVGDDINWGDASVTALHALHERGINIPNFVIGVEKSNRKGIEHLVNELSKFGKNIPLTKIHVCASVNITPQGLEPT